MNKVYVVCAGTTDFPQEEGVDAVFSSMANARAYIERILPNSMWQTRFGNPIRWNDDNDYWVIRAFPLDPIAEGA